MKNEQCKDETVVSKKAAPLSQCRIDIHIETI